MHVATATQSDFTVLFHLWHITERCYIEYVLLRGHRNVWIIKI